jgi:hypothetical protein
VGEAEEIRWDWGSLDGYVCQAKKLKLQSAGIRELQKVLRKSSPLTKIVF